MSVPSINVCVVGMGYVGLCLVAGLAKKGYTVTCVDIDKERIELIASGKAPIYEPSLEEYLAEGVKEGRISATTEMKGSVEDADITFICVGTPCDDTGCIDLKFIRNVAHTIGKILKLKTKFSVIAVKSTVIPGTTDGVVKPILEEQSGKKAGKDFGLAMTPEFLKEGSAIQDMMVPDKTVIGALDTKSSEMLDQLFAAYPGAIVRCDLRTNN